MSWLGDAPKTCDCLGKQWACWLWVDTSTSLRTNMDTQNDVLENVSSFGIYVNLLGCTCYCTQSSFITMRFVGCLSIMGDIRGTQAAVSIDSIVGVLGKEGYNHMFMLLEVHCFVTLNQNILIRTLLNQHSTYRIPQKTVCLVMGMYLVLVICWFCFSVEQTYWFDPNFTRKNGRCFGLIKSQLFPTNHTSLWLWMSLCFGIGLPVACKETEMPLWNTPSIPLATCWIPLVLVCWIYQQLNSRITADHGSERGRWLQFGWFLQNFPIWGCMPN